MTRYLLLGANGYLGHQVRRAILASGRGHYLAAVSGHAWFSSESTTCPWHRVDLVRASVSDVALLLDFTRPDVVINCTGCTVGSADRLEAVNVSVVRKLLEALTRVQPITLIHLGSAAEYGWQPAGLPTPESATPHPVTEYGRTKLMATDLITEAVAAGDVRAVVLRVFDPIGPGAPGHTLAGAALREIRRAMATRSTVVALERLRGSFDVLASADVADAVLRSANRPELPPILNVGRGVPTSGRSMVELLAAAAGFDGDIVESDGTGPSPGSVWQLADLTQLRRHLHWVPTTSIAEAVDALWRSAGAATVGRIGSAGIDRTPLFPVGPGRGGRGVTAPGTTQARR